MRVIFGIFLLISTVSIAKTTPAKEVAAFEEAVLDGRMAERTMRALDVVIGVAAAELVKRDHFVEAEQMVGEWNNRYRDSYLAFSENRKDIGDHQSWFPWLSDKLTMLRFVLGDDIMKMTHLSDLYVFCFAPYVVFRPCSFHMDSVAGERIDEYRRHFNEGSAFYGLTSVTVYWLTYSAVTVGTAGAGFVFLSGMVGSVGERLYATFVGGRLSDWVYNSACNKELANKYY